MFCRSLPEVCQTLKIDMKAAQRTSVDVALISLIQEGKISRNYRLKPIGLDKCNGMSVQDIDDNHLNELFELTLDIYGGDNNRNAMRMLPKEKKLVLIRQVAVCFRVLIKSDTTSNV